MDLVQIPAYVNICLAAVGAMMVLARGYKNLFFLFGQALVFCLFGLALSQAVWLPAGYFLALAAAWLIYFQILSLFSRFWDRLPWLILFALASFGCIFVAVNQSVFSLELITTLSLLLLAAAGLESRPGSRINHDRALDRLITGRYWLVLVLLAGVFLSQLWLLSRSVWLIGQLALTLVLIILLDTLFSLPYLRSPLSRLLKSRSKSSPDGVALIRQNLAFGHGWQNSLTAALEALAKTCHLDTVLVMLRLDRDDEDLRTAAAYSLPKEFQKLTLPAKSVFGQYLLDRKKAVVAEFLPWEEKDPAKARVMAEQFTFLRFAAAVPIFRPNQLEGLVLLGHRTDHRVYDQNQLGELDLLAENISWMLEGTRLEASKMLEFERIFALTGELSKAYGSLREKNETLAQTQFKLDSLAAELTSAAKAVQDGDDLVVRYQKLSQQLIGLSAEREKREKDLVNLKREREAFKAEIEALTETNRRLLTSTEGFATVSRELYEATKKAGEAKSYLENLLSRIDNGVIGINPEGNINTYNHTMEQLSGLHRADVAGQNFREALAGVLGRLAEIEALVRTILSGGHSGRVQIETVISTKQAQIPVAVSCGALKDAEGKIVGAIILINNLTERKQLEEAVAMRSKLESVSEMAISLNHEINNPLTSILCNIQYVLQKIAAKKDLMERPLVEGLESAEKESRRIKKILENIRRITIPVVEEYLPGTKMISFGRSVYGEAKIDTRPKTRSTGKKAASAKVDPKLPDPESDRSAGAGPPSSGVSE